MAAWFQLTEDHIRVAADAALVDSARAKATGELDPVTDAIESAAAEIRLAVSAGNELDPDEPKIPLAFKKLAVRMVIRELSALLGYAPPDAREEERAAKKDEKYLALFFERKVSLGALASDEAPQNRGSWNSENKIVGRMHPVPAPARQFPLTDGQYANPDAPEDNT